jgi:hypothetical protein
MSQRLEIEPENRGLFHEKNAKREKTNYPRFFYREAKRIGGPGMEKIYYVVQEKWQGKFLKKKGTTLCR